MQSCHQSVLLLCPSSILLVDDLQANLNTSQLRVKQLTSQEEERVDK